MMMYVMPYVYILRISRKKVPIMILIGSNR
nr:MAG TPA: hypothetical protein [Caudoviricetes sp.]